MEYKIVRSKRKTLVIDIRNGEVTIKAPKTMPDAHVKAFIEQKTKWIERKLAEHERRKSLLDGVPQLSQAMIHGTFYPIQSSDRYSRVTFDESTLFIPKRFWTDEKKATRALVKWYMEEARIELGDELNDVSEYTGLRYRSFALTNARTNWGSCDGDCNIRLNWRLVMLDAELVSYVVIHELAHTAHHNHSPEFWQKVESFMPNYASVRKRLKTYTPLTSMFR